MVEPTPLKNGPSLDCLCWENLHRKPPETMVCTMNKKLVGGAITILKNIKVNGKDYPIYEMENKKCLKPPTRTGVPVIFPNKTNPISPQLFVGNKLPGKSIGHRRSPQSPFLMTKLRHVGWPRQPHLIRPVFCLGLSKFITS